MTIRALSRTKLHVKLRNKLTMEIFRAYCEARR